MAEGFGSSSPTALPEPSCNYRIELDGIQVAAFESCTGVDSKWAEGTTRTGVDPLYKQTYSGLRQYEPVTLKRQLREGGAPDNRDLWNWHERAAQDKRTCAIVYLNRSGEEVERWELFGAWISRYKASDVDAGQESESLIAELTIRFDNARLA